MPLVKDFRSTERWKAFTLNSIVGSLSVVIAITTKQYLDRLNFYNKNPDFQNDFAEYKKVNVGLNIASIIITLLVTFSVSMIVYLFMYLVFGFGGGMLSTTN